MAIGSAHVRHGTYVDNKEALAGYTPQMVGRSDYFDGTMIYTNTW